MIYFTQFETRLCRIVLVGNQSELMHLHLDTGQGDRSFHVQDDWLCQPELFNDTQRQILEYLDGQRQTFDVALNLQGTEFQRKVWNQLMTIPYGQLVSYGDIATQLGNPNASRAVGAANSKNPIPIIVPCHRVIGAKGHLIGFSHGLKIKAELIQLEKTVKHSG